MRYTYRGDKFTDPALKGMQVDAVAQRKRVDGKDRCVRGRNGNMLVVDDAGRCWVVVGRQLRVNGKDRDKFNRVVNI